MTYEIYRYIFIGAAILSGIMLITAVLLFILLRIPKVIGDLTGRNAKRAIEDIRRQNENSGDKTYKSSRVNRERSKLTDKITESGRLLRNPTDVMGGAMATTKLDTEELLQGAAETTLLELTEEMNQPVSGGAETTVLTAGEIFEIEFEITYIHTAEMIE